MFLKAELCTAGAKMSEEADEELPRYSNSVELPSPVQHAPGLVLWGPVEKFETLQPGVQPNFHNPAVRLLPVPADSLLGNSQPAHTQDTHVPPVHLWQVGESPVIQSTQRQEDPFFVQSLHVQKKTVVPQEQTNCKVQPLRKYQTPVQPLHIHHQNTVQQDVPVPGNPVLMQTIQKTHQDPAVQSLIQMKRNSVELVPVCNKSLQQTWHQPTVQPLESNWTQLPGQDRHETNPEHHTSVPSGKQCFSETVQTNSCENSLCSCPQDVVVVKVEPDAVPETTVVVDMPAADKPSKGASTPVVQDSPTSLPTIMEDMPASSPVADRPCDGPITVVDADIVDLWQIIRITKGFSTHTDLAKFLLSVYVHFGDPDAPSSTSSSAENGTQTDAHCSHCRSALSMVCVNTACQMSSSNFQSPASQQVQALPTQMAYKQGQPVQLSTSSCPLPTRTSDSSEDEMGADDSTVISEHSDFEDNSDVAIQQKKLRQSGSFKNFTIVGNLNKETLSRHKRCLVPVVKLQRCDSPSFISGSGNVISKITTSLSVPTTYLKNETTEQDASPGAVSSNAKAKAGTVSVENLCSKTDMETESVRDSSAKSVSVCTTKTTVNEYTSDGSGVLGNNFVENSTNSPSVEASSVSKNACSENTTGNRTENTISVPVGNDAKEDNVHGENTTTKNGSVGEATGLGQRRTRSKGPMQGAVLPEPILTATGKYPICDGIHYRNGRVPGFYNFSEFRCSRCGKTFQNSQHIHRHIKNPSCDTNDDLFHAVRNKLILPPKRNSDDEWEPEEESSAGRKKRRGSDGEWSDDERPRPRKLKRYRTKKELTLDDFMKGKVRIPIGYPLKKDYFLSTKLKPIYSHYTCFECNTVFVPHEEFKLHQKVCPGRTDKKTVEGSERSQTSGQETGEIGLNERTGDQTSLDEKGEEQEFQRGENVVDKPHNDQTSQQGQSNKFDAKSIQILTEIKERLLFCCHLCNRVFLNKEQLKMHVLSHDFTVDIDGNHKCNFCGASFVKFLFIYRHLKLPKLRTPACAECGMKFKYCCQVPIHQKMHKELDDKREYCKECGDSLLGMSKAERTAHMKKHQVSSLTLRPVCGKDVPQEKFKGHMVIHSDERPFVCTICPDKRYRSKTALTNHIMVVHTHSNEKRYQCEECGNKYSTRNYLTEHKKCHLGLTFKCKECGRELARKAALKVHIRHVHRKACHYLCEVCGALHSDPYSLKDHMRCHTGEKPFQCPRCPAKFARKNYRNKHMRIHTGEKPYKCDDCEEAFITSITLRNHRQRYHADKTFPCGHCNKTFYIQSSLDYHTYVEHGGKYPYTIFKNVSKRDDAQTEHLGTVRSETVINTPPSHQQQLEACPLSEESRQADNLDSPMLEGGDPSLVTSEGACHTGSNTNSSPLH